MRKIIQKKLKINGKARNEKALLNTIEKWKT